MKTTLALSKSSKLPDVGARRRFQEFSLIFRDPVLFMSLLFSGIFIFIFVILPILRTISGGFISEEGNLDLSYFARYFDDFYGPGLRRAFLDTMTMGLLTAIFGTLVGFIFAYSSVRCNPPAKKFASLAGIVTDSLAALRTRLERDPFVRAQRIDYQESVRDHFRPRDE